MGRKGREVGSTCHKTQEILASLGRRKRESFVPFVAPANPPGVPDGGSPIVNH